MGTEQTTLQLQGEIKRLIQQLGKSQNEAARLIYTETNDFDDEDEIKRFEGRFKKQLQRETTKPVCLQSYIDILVKVMKLEAVTRNSLALSSLKALVLS